MKLTFPRSHVAPKYFKVLANSKMFVSRYFKSVNLNKYKQI